jgi:hypothetical protein
LDGILFLFVCIGGEKNEGFAEVEQLSIGGEDEGWGKKEEGEEE